MVYYVSMNNTKRIAVSDVDGTIVKGSLILNHAKQLHMNGVLNLGNLPEQWAKDEKNEDLITALAEAYRDAIKGLTPEDIYADEYIREITADSRNFYSTLPRLVNFRKDGHKVVLVSGSPSFLVERFGNTFNFESAASNYLTDKNGCFTGECVGMFSGDAKRKYLSTLGLSKYMDVLAFGDTRSDIPLFESANYSVLVEPNNDTRKALGSSVNEILSN